MHDNEAISKSSACVLELWGAGRSSLTCRMSVMRMPGCRALHLGEISTPAPMRSDNTLTVDTPSLVVVRALGETARVSTLDCSRPM